MSLRQNEKCILAVHASIKHQPEATNPNEDPQPSKLGLKNMQLRLQNLLAACPLEDFSNHCKLAGTVSENSEVIQRYTVSSRVFALAVK